MINCALQLPIDQQSPELFLHTKSQCIDYSTLQQNKRKHSQGSIATRCSEKNQSLEIDTFYCQHIHSSNSTVCKKCGAFYSKKFHLFGVKSQRFFSESWDIKNLRQLSLKFKTKQVKPLDTISREVIQKTSQKFGFSLSTQALAVYIYYTTFQGKNQFFQVIMCLFVAVKFLQHINPKSLKRYRRYLNKCFSCMDYVEMQSYILQKMNFDLNIPTFVNYIQSYLHQGTLISNESVDIVLVQNLIIERCKQILFKGAFMSFPPQVAASNILFFVRNRLGLKQAWCLGIQKITDLKHPYIIFTTSEAGKIFNSF